jgi:hypothetical protein
MTNINTNIKIAQRLALANAVNAYLASNNDISRYRASKRRFRWMSAGQKNSQRPRKLSDLI